MVLILENQYCLGVDLNTHIIPNTEIYYTILLVIKIILEEPHYANQFQREIHVLRRAAVGV